MKNVFATVCLLIATVAACATEPAQPTDGVADEPAAAPMAPAAESPAAEAPISALADEQCLNYCTGGGRTPFMTCVPVCRKGAEVYFPPEPVKLELAPYCGDKICQLPDELNRNSDRFCLQDCRLRVEVTRTRLTINGKLIVEAEGENLLMRSSAFDAGL